MKLRCAAVLLRLASPAFAADIDGTWAGTVDSPNRAVTITFTFKAEDSKLTGTLVGPDGNNVAIADGTVSDDMISFSQTIDFGGVSFTFAHKGQLVKDSLTPETFFMDAPIDVMLTRSTGPAG